MPAMVSKQTEDEAFLAALEYTGRECMVHYVDDVGGTVMMNDAVVLAITIPFVTVLCRGAELPIMFDRQTLKHVTINDDGELVYPNDLELRGIPNVTIH